MSFVAISRFTIANGMAQEVKDAFRNRPGYVEEADGFLRMDVLSPVELPEEIWLITYWASEESYKLWHRSAEFRRSQSFIPKGLKVVPGSTSIQLYEHITS